MPIRPRGRWWRKKHVETGYLKVAHKVKTSVDLCISFFYKCILWNLSRLIVSDCDRPSDPKICPRGLLGDVHVLGAMRLQHQAVHVSACTPFPLLLVPIINPLLPDESIRFPWPAFYYKATLWGGKPQCRPLRRFAPDTDVSLQWISTEFRFPLFTY